MGEYPVLGASLIARRRFTTVRRRWRKFPVASLCLAVKERKGKEKEKEKKRVRKKEKRKENEIIQD